jgi:AcrR family transcriptional regulator
MTSPDSNPDQDTTRLRILEAAEEVFAEKGFEAATVRDICERAGVKNIGAVNYYFQGKERLYAEAVKFALRTCASGAPFPEWPADTSPVRKLRDFIKVLMTRLLAAPKVASMKLWMRELSDPTAACAEAVRENILPMAQLLRSIVGELLPDASDEKRWMTGFSIVGQCMFYRVNRAAASILMGPEKFGQLTVDVIADHIADFTLAALRTRARR